jgi:hypothetical protein
MQRQPTSLWLAALACAAILVFVACSEHHCPDLPVFSPDEAMCVTTDSCADQAAWGSCDVCVGLDVATCKATAGCHAVVVTVNAAFTGRPDIPPSSTCVGVAAPSSEGSGCNFGATECVEHDDCVSNYVSDHVGTEDQFRTTFQHCNAE